MRKKALIVLVSFFLFVFSCKNEKQIQFDSKKWKVEKDLEFYPFRELMLKDIIKNELFVGLNYKNVADSLGIPEKLNLRDTNAMYYIIENDYGWDIDPVYTKHLKLSYDSDSVVDKVEILEWDKFEKK